MEELLSVVSIAVALLSVASGGSLKSVMMLHKCCMGLVADDLRSRISNHNRDPGRVRTPSKPPKRAVNMKNIVQMGIRESSRDFDIAYVDVEV